MIAIQAPEYFPGIATFALLRKVDHFVIADTRQYSRQSFQNRAKVRTPDGWQWLTVPLKGRQHGRRICDVQIDNSVKWQTKHRRSLAFNYRSSPYFEFYEDRISGVLDREWQLLGDLTSTTVTLLAELLNCPTPAKVTGALQSTGSTTAEILRAVGDENLAVLEEPSHLNRKPGSSSILSCRIQPYRQVFDGFEHGMSVLDLLFNYGPEAGAMIDSWTHIRCEGE